MKALVIPALAVAILMGGQPEKAAPPVVDAGCAGSAPGAPVNGKAPSDAIVLFDGSSTGEWQHSEGKPAQWTAHGGAMTVKPGSGNIATKREFGDCQIHVEFATPIEVAGESQGRGNSGVYIQGRYEVQVLDSYQNTTYPEGQCGAIYGYHIPMVNACRKPGEWQEYDIVFRAPRFDGSGTKTGNATVTVFHNGILIIDHGEVPTPTGSAMAQNEKPRGPIMLQDHGNPVSYRNLWVRELRDRP